MAKDKGGHGSEKRGVSGVQARNDRMHAMFENARTPGHPAFTPTPMGGTVKPTSNPHDGGPIVPGYTSPGAMRLQAVMRASGNPPIVGIPASGVGGGQPVESNAHAAATLSNGGAKSAPVDTHPAMATVAAFHDSFDRRARIRGL